MDNNTTNQTNNSDGGLFHKPDLPANPISSGKFSAFLNSLKSRKKLLITVFAIIILFIALFYISFGALKSKFFPNSKVAFPFTNPTSQIQTASMRIKTAKSSFAVSEKIPVSIVAGSNETAITGFDTVIEYDPAFLTLSQRQPPPLTDFNYFGKNTNTTISVSAVQKADSNTQVKLNNTTLFELEFTPKKIGKTILKIIYMPGSTIDSNLLDGSSKDILGSAAGVEITIN